MDLSQKQALVAAIVEANNNIEAQRQQLADSIRPVVKEFGKGPHLGPNGVMVEFRKTGETFSVSVTDPASIT